jgi:endonuclease/exonuclease/phosphatase family metal-dependent hydrolase
VGLLSKFPILATQRFQFQRQQSDPDLNQRVALWALLDTSSHLSGVKYSRLNVIVTHFSYEKSTQCNNLLELMKAIHHDIPSAASGYPFVILGDFNAYNDSSAPLDLIFADQTLPLVHRCGEAMARERVTIDHLRQHKWIDAWRHANPSANETLGYTFSTMPWPGLVCRPDRILVSGLSVDNVIIDKSSKAYKREYFWKINFSRLTNAGYSVDLLIFQIVLILIVTIFSTILCMISRTGRALASIMLFVLIIALLIFSSRIWTIWSVAFHPQQEDYNPSDHLLLLADLRPSGN